MASSYSQDPVVSARDLRVRFGEREVLHGLTFDVRRGETLVVIGGGYTFGGYMLATRDALLLRDISSGVIKSVVFGMVITAVGCREGFATGAGAEEVGRSTTSAVVISILLVIVIDLIFTGLFYLARGGN